MIFKKWTFMIYLDVFNVTNDKLVLSNASGPVQDIGFTLFYQCLPIGRFGLMEINLNQSVIGGIFVGPKQENRSHIGDVLKTNRKESTVLGLMQIVRIPYLVICFHFVHNGRQFQFSGDGTIGQC